MELKKTKNFAAILVDNKCDLEKEERKVSKEEGKKYAKDIEIEFLESSVWWNEDIKKIFRKVVKKKNKID